MKQEKQLEINDTSSYGPNNPEPEEFKDSARTNQQKHDALHAVLEYIDGKN